MHICRVQLLGLSQNESVLHLLRYHAEPFLPSPQQLHVSLRECGETRSLRAADTADLLKKTNRISLNEVLVKPARALPFDTPGVGRVTMISMVLEVSPNNESWLRATGKTARTRSGACACATTARNAELFGSGYSRNVAPSDPISFCNACATRGLGG